jgi:ATP-dependent DNA ligase
MELSNPVLSGLIRKRQDIAAEIDTLQANLRVLVADIDALDSTIRLFDPTIPIESVRVRPTVRRHAAKVGDNSKLILSLLREADGPMTHRELTQKVMEHRGLNVADRMMFAAMRNRVGASLRGLRARGVLASGTGPSGRMKWWVA